MKPCVHTCRLRLLLLLAVALLMTMTTALARESVSETTSCARIDIKAGRETAGSCKDTAITVGDQKNLELLNELLQTDSSLQAELAENADQPADAARAPEPAQ